jgi:hypothetical protein
MLLQRIFAAVLGLAEEVASQIVKDVKATYNGATMDWQEAMDRGRTKLAVFAKRERFDYDPNSVNDTFLLLKRKVFPHDEHFTGSVDDLKRKLAEEMGIEGYAMTAEQNDKLRTELQIMVGYGDIVLER